MEHFRLFVLPFWVGAGFLLVVLLYKYISWFIGLAPAERKMFWRSLPTRATWKSVCEIGSESLLHRKIWRTNPLLGYMHTSFALGWFLLILTGWIETLVYFKGHNVPLYVDIFFSYYVHPIFERNFNFSLIKDALLLLILIGIGLALFKRIRSRAMGMRRTTKHVLGDRIALTALVVHLSGPFAGREFHQRRTVEIRWHRWVWATRCTLSRRESAAAVS